MPVTLRLMIVGKPKKQAEKKSALALGELPGGKELRQLNVAKDSICFVTT